LCGRGRRLASIGARDARRLSGGHPGRGPGPDHGRAAGRLGGSSSTPTRGPTPRRRKPSTACSSSASAGRSAPCSACGSIGTPTFSLQAAGARLHRPAAESGCSRSSWPPPRRWSTWRVIWSLISASLAHFLPSRWSGSSDQAGPVAALLGGRSSSSTCRRRPLGMALERSEPLGRTCRGFPVQRFGYRQLMYYVSGQGRDHRRPGPRVTWGKLERRRYGSR